MLDPFIHSAANVIAYISIAIALFLCFAFLLAWISFTLDILCVFICKPEHETPSLRPHTQTDDA